MPQSTTEARETDRGLFAMFKGPSGSGKSVGALSFPNAYVFDHDSKMPNIALKHFPKVHIEYDTFRDIFKVSERLVELTNDCPYETLICDTLTSLSYTCIKSIDEVKDSNVLKMLANVKATKKGGQTIELRGFDYYNGEDSFLKYYIDGLKELWARPGNPKHVIMIAHCLDSEQKNIVSGITTHTRRIVTAGNKIAAYIPAQFDDVWHFATQSPFGASLDVKDERVQRIVCTEQIGEDDAKTAFDLPAKINFTGGSLYDKIKHVFMPKANFAL